MNRPGRTRVLAAGACLVVASLGLAACSDSESTSGTSTTTAAATPVNGTKPQVVVPDTKPDKLTTRDIKVGEGAEAKKGDSVTVQYVGVAFSTKKEFDASWNRGQPFNFTLGQGDVIKGWDEGVVGMKVGGQRELVIPPDMGYGARGAGADIGPNETLVFVVDLVSIQ